MVTFSFTVVFHGTRHFFVTMSTAILVFVGRAELVSVATFRGLPGERFVAGLALGPFQVVFIVVVGVWLLLESEVLMLVIMIVVVVVAVAVVVP